MGALSASPPAGAHFAMRGVAHGGPSTGPAEVGSILTVPYALDALDCTKEEASSNTVSTTRVHTTISGRRAGALHHRRAAVRRFN